MSHAGEPYSSELTQLEHELQILRERYDTIKRSALTYRKYFFILSIVLTPLFTGIAWLFLDENSGLGLAALGFVLSVFCYLVALLVPESTWMLTDQNTYFGNTISEGEAIPGMIAEREARIAEIKKISP